ncbi:helix-turn-helix transcriptional regulator [Metaclostridioides mangenotii]
MEMTKFISNLKKYRQLKKLTQQELADKVNVRRETVARLENAKYNPSLELAVRISKVLDTPIKELFNFEF